MIRRARAGRVVALAALALTLVAPAHTTATTVLPMDLRALTAGADRIFLGRVVTVEPGRDGNNLPATWVTFAVDQALKGAPDGRVTIKQLGVATPLPDGTLYRIPALPTYREGDEVLLFLHPDSAAGFTSPVGFGQGRFRVRREGGGATAENDAANVMLEPAVPASARPPATLPGSRAAAPASGSHASAPSPSGPHAATGVVPSVAIVGPVPLDDLLARVRTLVDEER